MQDQKRYTLETLATEFGLTPRMARYYVEKLLPEHHKTGRGKLAEYGPDTWNCFAFIQKARDELKLSLEQIRDVLAKLSQHQIDRVARGEEEIAIVTTPAEPELPPEARAHYYPSRDWAPEDSGPMISKMSVEGPNDRPASSEFDLLPGAAHSRRAERASSVSRAINVQAERTSAESGTWNTVYEDDRVRIVIRGFVSEEQREEIQLTARLMRKVLELGS